MRIINREREKRERKYIRKEVGEKKKKSARILKYFWLINPNLITLKNYIRRKKIRIPSFLFFPTLFPEIYLKITYTNGPSGHIPLLFRSILFLNSSNSFLLYTFFFSFSKFWIQNKEVDCIFFFFLLSFDYFSFFKRELLMAYEGLGKWIWWCKRTVRLYLCWCHFLDLSGSSITESRATKLSRRTAGRPFRRSRTIKQAQGLYQEQEDGNKSAESAHESF